MKKSRENKAINTAKTEVRNIINSSISDNRSRLKKEKEDRFKKRIEKSKLSNWLTLDNAGVIYPSLREENWDFVYRVSVVLKNEVNPEILQKAVADLEPRFPSFFVRMKTGFFWNYFEALDNPLVVEKEESFPCSRFKKGSNAPLIRVLYYGKRISFECFHALADGRSSLKFLNSLVKRYVELCGEVVQDSKYCLNFMDRSKREELEDSFSVYADKSKKLKHKEFRAYSIKGTPEEYSVVNSTIAEMRVSQLKDIARSYNAKLFEFLIAVLAKGILKRVLNTEKKNRPIKISVPVDLRQFFESESLRNFSGYLNVEVPIDKNLTFQEIVEIVKSEMTKITKDRMQGFINSNVAIKKNWFIKIIPLFIKNFFINLFFKNWGEAYQTLAVSNLGLNILPKEFENYIERFEFNLGRPKYNAKSMGLVSYGDKLVCILSSKIKENTTEKDFLTELASMGADIIIGSNRRDLYE